MYRRTMLVASGPVLAGMGGSSRRALAEAQTEADDDPTASASLEFAGDGVTVTDEFEVESGPAVLEVTHDGEGEFFVQAVSRDGGQTQSLLTQFGPFDGTTGTFLEEGTYAIYVDADGEWELQLSQPDVDDDEAETPPISVTNSGPGWLGPILFDDTTLVGGAHDGDGSFRVRVIPQDADASDYVWDGGELVFHALGEFRGATSVHVDGIGYIDVTVDNEQAEWAIELE
ncbi:hypothetical protein [Natronorubrum sp. A-ect3]|uniref:hypothetical protein n=1 Tax=Natronorubrum sp. A-ect3 TaxID=3242698 RepID=UPI00359E4866